MILHSRLIRSGCLRGSFYMFSFKDLLNSESYQKESEKWAKIFIFVSFSIAAYFMFFTNYEIGWNWFWLVPVLLFGSSILLAMPSMVLFTYLSFLYGKNVEYQSDGAVKPKNLKGRMIGVLKSMWSLCAPIACGFIVYNFIILVIT